MQLDWEQKAEPFYNNALAIKKIEVFSEKGFEGMGTSLRLPRSFNNRLRQIPLLPASYIIDWESCSGGISIVDTQS